MEFRRIHHVAIVHESGAPLLATLAGTCGLEVDDTEDGPGFTERMWPVGESHLQTLEATGDGVVRRSVDARGPGLHHIAFEVDDLNAALEGREVLIAPNSPSPGVLVAFVVDDGAPVELMQIDDV